jgi:hypothetical protein
MMRKKFLSALLALILMLSVRTLFSQSTLMLDPKRIVFENAKRTDMVTMYNSSNDTMTYFIGFKHFNMLENGSLEVVDSLKSISAFPDSLFRFFPRAVKLNPHSSQAVRLQFIKPKDLASGEYRTHLYIVEAQPKPQISATPSDTDKSISLNIHALVSMAIPIIARYQTKGATVSLGNLSLSNKDTAGLRTATFVMHREGDESCYGNLVLTYKDPGGKTITVSEMKGTGLYVTLAKRNYTITFKPPASVKFEAGGALKLEYYRADGSTKNTLLASTELQLAK